MLTAHDRTRIAAEAVMCERTVRRVYLGHGTSYSKLRVAAAAKALGLPEPCLDSSSTSSPTLSPGSSKSA